jgi:hypothetical protein
MENTMKYTVLLLVPDYLSSNYGHEAYLAFVEAASPAEAIELAQEEANSRHAEGREQDFHPLYVCEGHHEDVKGDEPETVTIPLTEAERRALSVLLMNASDDTSSNLTARLATSILEKLRHAN